MSLLDRPEPQMPSEAFFLFPIVLLVASYAQCHRSEKMQTSVPAILVWYGNQQSFGKLGNPQHWVNILGNVSGSPLKSLTYSLNGAPPLALAIGTPLSPPGSAACPEVPPKPLDAKS